LKGVFEEAETAKNAWIATDTQLRAERTAMDTADPAVEQSVKDAKDQEITDHQVTKANLISSMEDAERFRDEKIQNI
jgi:hypothetical protein